MKTKFKLIVLLGALATHCPILAQEKEPVLVSVAYEFVHINNLNNPENPIREEMILRLGKTTSRYTSLTNENNEKRGKQSTTAIPSGPVRVVSGGPLAVVNAEGLTNEGLFQDLAKKLLIKIAPLGMHTYKVESSLPIITWKIFDEKRKIGDYTCQKAVGEYAGRIYTAWFSKELPFQSGPWKLSGLPGLILEATDNKKEVLFLFKEISKPEEDEYTNSNSTRIVSVSEAAFMKAKKAFQMDPGSTMQSQLPANAPTVQVAYRNANGKTVTGEDAKAQIDKNNAAARLRKNNPIELTVSEQ